MAGPIPDPPSSVPGRGPGRAADRAVDREQLAVDVADLVHAVSRHIGRAAKAELEPLGITWGQVRALRAIAGADGPLRMGLLADRLGVVPRSATGVVDGLEEQGLVARTRDPGDRRAVAVEPTAAGRGLLEQLAARRRAAADQVLAPLTAADLRTVRDLLAGALAAPVPGQARMPLSSR